MSIRTKMKFSFVLLLLLGMEIQIWSLSSLQCLQWHANKKNVCFPDIPHLKGQQKIEEFQHLRLRLTFPSLYNRYYKFCCKLYPGRCYKLLDSTGYTCDSLKGRVAITENDGWIEFKLSNVRFVDGGYYRCIVVGTQNPVYSDYYVEVFGKHPYNLYWCDVMCFMQLLLLGKITHNIITV